MLHRLKSTLRDAIPHRHQVPIKYWYSAARRHLEPEMALLPYLVGRDAHVIDVGGNRGIYAYVLGRLGARLEIFEPNPLCSGILSDWATHRSDVRVHPVALSANPGSAMLHVPVDAEGVAHDASASVEAHPTGKTHDIPVELRTLDSFGFRDVDFIKIDTEGHEMAVIDGAQETLSASMPALLIEIEERHHAGEPISTIFARVTALGYAGFFLKDGQLAPIDRFEPLRDQSMAAFERGSAYFNNFLFLAHQRIARGDYAALAGRWIDQRDQAMFSREAKASLAGTAG